MRLIPASTSCSLPSLSHALQPCHEPCHQPCHEPCHEPCHAAQPCFVRLRVRRIPLAMHWNLALQTGYKKCFYGRTCSWRSLGLVYTVRARDDASSEPPLRALVSRGCGAEPVQGPCLGPNAVCHHVRAWLGLYYGDSGLSLVATEP